jgi:hypothetical protein
MTSWKSRPRAAFLGSGAQSIKIIFFAQLSSFRVESFHAESRRFHDRIFGILPSEAAHSRGIFPGKSHLANTFNRLMDSKDAVSRTTPEPA